MGKKNLTLREALKLRPRSRTNKYGAKRVEVDGIDFASHREARRYRVLIVARSMRLLRNLELQPRFPIVINGEPVRFASGRQLEYRADFRYEQRQDDGSWRTVVEDSKGHDTPVSKIKRALVRATYGVTVDLV